MQLGVDAAELHAIVPVAAGASNAWCSALLGIQHNSALVLKAVQVTAVQCTFIWHMNFNACYVLVTCCAAACTTGGHCNGWQSVEACSWLPSSLQHFEHQKWLCASHASQ
jgi:hypothetical protein